MQKKKEKRNMKTNPNAKHQGEKKSTKKDKHKKVIGEVKMNGYESFGSDENVDDQYKKSKAMRW